MTLRTPDASDAELTAVLTPLATETWPVEKLLLLYWEWIKGTPTVRMGELLKTTKHAAVSKVRQLIDKEILVHRPSPILAASAPLRIPSARPLPPGASTLPPLPSQQAAP